MKGSTVKWEDGLMKDLKDPEFAAGFVNACLDEGVSFQVALGNVVKAQGYSFVARKVRMTVSTVIRAVQPKANPTLATIRKILHGIGLDLTVRLKKNLPKRSTRIRRPEVA